MGRRKKHGIPDRGANRTTEGRGVTPDSGELGATGFAFETLRAGLHRFLWRRLRRAEDIEDLTQEIYLRLLRFADRTQVKSPQAYVFRVAFNVLSEYKSHQHRAPVTFDSEAAESASEHLPDSSDSPDEIHEQQCRQSHLKILIDRLPPMQRLVLLMSTRQDMSYEEIAAKLAISASTARVHLYRAIGHLRDSVSRE